MDSCWSEPSIVATHHLASFAPRLTPYNVFVKDDLTDADRSPFRLIDASVLTSGTQYP